MAIAGGEQSNDGFFDDSSSISSSDDGSSVRESNSFQAKNEARLASSLADVLSQREHDDSLLEDGAGELRVSLWLQSLDLHVMGGCRSDERLAPFMNVNGSNNVADDHFLVHLSQHFEPPEVGVLARCFCAPLVSMRVGRINRHGNLLCPTASRHTSDDGHSERLFVLNNSNSESVSFKVDWIAADLAARSFFIKVAQDTIFFFWCSERSIFLGMELLAKMKDVLERRPSVSELTGISKPRLDCFATRLRASATSIKSRLPPLAPEAGFFKPVAVSPKTSSFTSIESGSGLPTSTSTTITTTTTTPYYCWCSGSASLSLSPSLQPSTGVTSMAQPLEFPPFLPEPLIRLPRPSTATPPLLPPFIPLMCDPIVHIPLIDVCSSGHCYHLVSSGSTKLASPLIPETQSLVEKSARETLQALIRRSSPLRPDLADDMSDLTPADSDSTTGASFSS